MPDREKKFHEFALKSILFKGRTDWYYCYLKAEKVAHALAFLSQKQGSRAAALEELLHAASTLPNTIVHFCAGEVGLEVLLADIFILISNLRWNVTNGLITTENGRLCIEAYEELAEKMARSNQLSPFISQDDLLVPPLPLEEVAPLPAARQAFKGHAAQAKNHKTSQGQSERAKVILDYIKRHKNASIKDLSLIITDCSEKTIQRELGLLIAEGLIKKEGERRWSVYSLV